MYMSPRLFRPATVDDIIGPAIVIHVRSGQEKLLVTGGDKSHVIFLSGDFMGQGFVIKGSNSWEGMAYENIEFQVDVESAKPVHDGVANGSIVRSTQGMAIYASVESAHGFKEPTSILLGGDYSAGSGNVSFSYSKWRAVVRDQEDTHVVFEWPSSAADVTPS